MFIGKRSWIILMIDCHVYCGESKSVSWLAADPKVQREACVVFGIRRFFREMNFGERRVC